MDLRFYPDPETGEPHIHNHGVSEEEAVAEDEAAFERAHLTMMPIPHELVPAVRELIFEYEEEHQIG